MQGLAVALVEPPALSDWREQPRGGWMRCRRLQVGTAWRASRGPDGGWYAYPDETYPPCALPIDNDCDEPPLLVVLPGRILTVVDPQSGWRLEGTPPALTLRAAGACPPFAPANEARTRPLRRAGFGRGAATTSEHGDRGVSFILTL